MMASEMVERVARAIVAELSRQDGVEGATWVLENGSLAFLDQENPDMFAVARAAIDAMREPTQGMLKLADDASEGSGFWTLPPWEAWPVMIDAALGEG